MKIILFGLLGLLLFSCNQNNKNEEIISNQKKFSFTANNEIIGNWTMCSSSSNGIMIQFNSCPTVSFLSDSSGIVGNLIISVERFIWTFNKGKLKIITNSKISNAIFLDTFYFAGITSDQNLKRLLIRSTKNDSQFYLTK